MGSLPADKYPSKVPDLPSDDTNYFILKTPKELGNMKRPWSKSEPLNPEKPKFDMINDIWKDQPTATSKSSDPFSKQSSLKSIPDNGVASPTTTFNNKTLFSPGTQKMIDNI